MVSRSGGWSIVTTTSIGALGRPNESVAVAVNVVAPTAVIGTATVAPGVVTGPVTSAPVVDHVMVVDPDAGVRAEELDRDGTVGRRRRGRRRADRGGAPVSMRTTSLELGPFGVVATTS